MSAGGLLMEVATTLAGEYVQEVTPSGVAAVASISPSVPACELPELRVLRHEVWRSGVGKWQLASKPLVPSATAGG